MSVFYETVIVPLWFIEQFMEEQHDEEADGGWNGAIQFLCQVGRVPVQIQHIPIIRVNKNFVKLVVASDVIQRLWVFTTITFFCERRNQTLEITHAVSRVDEEGCFITLQEIDKAWGQGGGE